MRRKNILDSSALLRFLQKEPGFEIVKDLLEKAQVEKEPLVLNLINWGEVYYVLKKNFGKDLMEKTLSLLEEMPISLYPISKDLIAAAANLKADKNLPFVDSICAATAIAEKGRLITSDADFKKVEKEIPLLWAL